MSCALTQGYNMDCRDSVGGIKSDYIIETEGIESFTLTDGVITAIVKAAGKRFWKYNLPRESGNANSDLVTNEQNGTNYSPHTVQLNLNKQQTAVRNEIVLLGKNNTTHVVIDNNGKGWIYGLEYGLVLNANAPTGSAWGDRNGYTLNFAGNEKELAYEVSSSVISALETPGS